MTCCGPHSKKGSFFCLLGVVLTFVPLRAGQGDALGEEVKQLKRLARRGASAAQLSKIASAISAKTAHALPSPLKPTPKVSSNCCGIFSLP